ncbi:uncharacterized protein LOC111407382 [Olea europaea var. sylvestris]|uniref:uncharacterized protein LOC111407382 n=1 Tax=Olea europaea var. sylvestris TaxID=158386 RepID=UPI000C1D568B|nr:uncharacterized protein LOC111407382 [Olea europaea var. sylvestris]
MSSTESNTCAICLGNVTTGQAIFTAECSHSFHFGCIGDSVSHGNFNCPICRAKWNCLPVSMPNFDPNVPPRQFPTHFSNVSQPLTLPTPPSEPESLVFSDDEPLPIINSEPTSSSSLAGLQSVNVKSIPERPVLAASESISQFAVLVGVRAPPLSDNARHLERAPIDLVTVLDVSGSMHGSKLHLLKRAAHFVVDNLGPSDRLSIVSFSSTARRIFPLRRITGNGREDARRAIDSLQASGMTNIVEGLKKGVRVLEERHLQNPVASIIFLSDGKDTCYRRSIIQNSSNPGQSPRLNPEYLHLMPDSICPRNRGSQDESQQQRFPVHTFGFGTDHDPVAMHAISDESGGTFSFIESYEMVQDAFASCIGGLLSVVAQELRITVRSASNGVEIISIPSGRYASEISDQGCQGVINVGDLYADEEKEFLVNLSVPVLRGAENEENEGKTLILDVVCSYRDVVSKEMVRVEGDLVEIRRPKVPSPADTAVNLEVDRQRNRLSAAEGIAEAQRIAETGNLTGARAALSRRRERLRASASTQAGDGLSNWLEADLKKLKIEWEVVSCTTYEVELMHSRE